MSGMQLWAIRTAGSFLFGWLVIMTGSNAFGSDGVRIDAASERFEDADSIEIPDFQKHVSPLLGRLGCNGRACHGSFQGQGGLRLSLFGYDFAMDHQSLTASQSDGGGRRLDRDTPDASLILKKPLAQTDHEGGQRFPEGSWQHHLLRNWIKSGALGIETPKDLLRLEVEPSEVVFRSEAQSVSLHVVAVWEDGVCEDVTPLCRFRTNDDSVVQVSDDGVLESVGPGDSHVIVFYDNGITAVPVIRPHQDAASSLALQADDEPTGDRTPGIDFFVADKLRKLAIIPSDQCTDSEFLRRVSLDLTGTLPAPSEVEAFLLDRSPDKRQRKVDELLRRPAYAAWWANKLCDFTGCNPAQQAEVGQETSVQWYGWIFQRLQENVPYDELVRRIVLAKSRETNQSYDEYAEETSSYFRSESQSDFAERETMPHYWTRRSMQKPDDAAQAFAHNFLGVRLQCAQCHKHPFAPWTQDDFNEFSRFFESIKFGVTSDSQARYRELAQQVGLNVRNDDGASINNDVLRQAQRGRTVPWRELYIDRRSEDASIHLLRSGAVQLDTEQDPREPIMQWMSHPDNPYFAKAFVNRVWAGYFHSGIIDPPDDLNPANPPSNPALLDWLVSEFIAHGMDMKWLHRTIATSETYQRSWVPNATNQNDRRHFSRAIPRRMPAEVVYDSVKQAIVASEQTEEVRNDLTRRAIGHLSMRLAGTYAMQVFGKPERAVNCDCERDNQPTLLQAIFLQNDPLMDQRLQESGWLEELQQQQSEGAVLVPEQLVRQAWLRALSREPSEDESARAVEHLRDAPTLIEGTRDLLWALLNTKEFLLIK